MKKLALILLPLAVLATSQLVGCEEKDHDSGHDHSDSGHDEE